MKWLQNNTVVEHRKWPEPNASTSILFYNYICAMRIPAALCSNDAKSFYNRIVLLIVALALCQLGASVSVMQSMVATLAQLQHHVWSVYGNSTSMQGQADWPEPVTGIGQGNGAGPQFGQPLVCLYLPSCDKKDL